MHTAAEMDKMKKGMMGKRPPVNGARLKAMKSQLAGKSKMPKKAGMGGM